MEKKYKQEIERMAKKYDHWDSKKQPYALMLYSLEGDRKIQFNTMKFVGGEAFRENVNCLLESCSPDVILIDEFSGMKGKPLNKEPMRIEIKEQPHNEPRTVVERQVVVQQPVQAPQYDSLLQGLEGIEGFESVKSGLGAVIAFERNIAQKNQEIQELRFNERLKLMESQSKIERLEDKLDATLKELNQLRHEKDRYESEIEDLEDELETLREEVQKHQPHKMVQSTLQGIGSNFLMQMVEKSPKMRGMLGFDDLPDAPVSAPKAANDFVGGDDSQLTDAQREIKRTVNDIAGALATWPVRHLRNIIKIIAYIEDNEQRQDLIKTFIDQQINEEYNTNEEEEE